MLGVSSHNNSCFLHKQAFFLKSVEHSLFSFVVEFKAFFLVFNEGGETQFFGVNDDVGQLVYALFTIEKVWLDI